MGLLAAASLREAAFACKSSNNPPRKAPLCAVSEGNQLRRSFAPEGSLLAKQACFELRSNSGFCEAKGARRAQPSEGGFPEGKGAKLPSEASTRALRARTSSAKRSGFGEAKGVRSTQPSPKAKIPEGNRPPKEAFFEEEAERSSAELRRSSERTGANAKHSPSTCS